MGTAIVAGVFTLAGMILGTALEWLRGNAERRRADARELADLIAQLRVAVGTFRGFGGILHTWSEAVTPGDAPQWGLVKAALEDDRAADGRDNRFDQAYRCDRRRALRGRRRRGKARDGGPAPYMLKAGTRIRRA